MQLLITIPRSGSHLFAQMMQFKMIVTFQKGKAKPEELPPSVEHTMQVLNRFRSTGRYWLHLPFQDTYIPFVQKAERTFLLLRDPRDIVISCAHIVDQLPSIGLNYYLEDGRRFRDLSMSKRINYLIDTMQPLFQWFEYWRLFGIETLHFEDYIERPEWLFEKLSHLGYGTVDEIRERAAYQHPYHFRNGKAENWKTEMTATQKKKANQNFADFIDAWKCDE